MNRTAIVAAALMCSFSARAEDISKTFPASGIDALAVETGAGDVSVSGGGSAFAVTVVGFDAERCVLTMEPEGGTLRLKAETKRGRGFFEKGCKAGFRVTAPSATPLQAGVGAGTITLDGLAGSVRAATGAGSIRGSVASSSAELSTGAGAIDLAWTKAPRDGKVRASAGAGSVRLSFPAGTRLAADLGSGLGSVSNEIGDAKDAALKVKASSGVGEVSLIKS